MVVRVPEHGSRAVEMEEGIDGMESPLDVLSRAATMVEAVNTSSARTPGRVLETSTTSTPGREDTENSPPSQVTARRSSSFKEVHPKFRKHSAPEYLAQADTVRSIKLSRQSSLSSSISSSSSQHCSSSHTTISEYSSNLADSSLISNSSLDDSSPMDDTPLDFSLKKRSSPSPPPPYRYSNPLRQHSPQEHPPFLRLDFIRAQLRHMFSRCSTLRHILEAPLRHLPPPARHRPATRQLWQLSPSRRRYAGKSQLPIQPFLHSAPDLYPPPSPYLRPYR
ncbi:uncharacterized protein LOC111707836 isoform X2 [Eurytemora carolleeae]|nr:uncharacterized protein LOC111707836 isoform X2 [Eurytemora carolleeae]|eukprot:XP_023336767.1 uncharacterized protein LOC111707836 isoform X2 [Eurytemora affinis]